MDDDSKRRAAQLGMPTGTAFGRLRKMILFEFAKQLSQDICFRCGSKIATLDEFSIEHKQAWLDNDPALFWNIDNIAFSHLKCNIGAARKPLKILWPEGEAWCSRCKVFKLIKEFPKSKTNRRGTHCTECLKKSKASWRSKTGKH